MACGLPVIGTFELSKYKGMEVCRRDIQEAETAIKHVDLNYDQFRKDAVENATENSYSNRVHGLVKLYSEYRERIFSNQLEIAYQNTNIVYMEARNRIKVTFDDGAKVNISGSVQKKYKIKFIDKLTNTVSYETEIYNGMWAGTSTKYYNKWMVEVYDITDGIETLVQSETMDLKNRTVKVVFDSESLGDLLAWIGSVDEFQKKHQCKMYCVVFNKHLRAIFEKNYSNIKFLAVDVYAEEYYARYKIGCFDGDNSWTVIPKNARLLNLCSIANAVLGITDIQYKPKISFDVSKYKNKKKYVCIAMQSTCQAKYWNNKGGWSAVVKYLKTQGYEVWCIDRYNSFGVKEQMNYMPEGCIDKTGDFTLEERMEQIAGAKFFIGLSSGLSWLAWAADVPVVMISGFTKAYNEFNTPYRVINENVCNGCWNDKDINFDKANWFWCPRNKDFECSKQISVQSVLEQVKKLI
jgi:autotransporter strand-loop-strand O-heptosyltransferase